MDASDAEIVEELRGELVQTVALLDEAGAPREALAAVQTPRRILFVARGSRLVPVGTVWHLGVFLLAPDATLFATGSTTRAVEPGRPNYQSLSGEERRSQRAAALRGGFAPGESVNFDASPITLDAEELRNSSGRLFIHGGRALVRWRADADPDSSIEFSSYLRERAGLLIEPPVGA